MTGVLVLLSLTRLVATPRKWTETLGSVSVHWGRLSVGEDLGRAKGVDILPRRYEDLK